MIFFLAFAAVWLGFQRFPQERATIFASLMAIFVTNLGLSVTPCYHTDKFECCRILLQVSIVGFCFTLAICWYLYFANQEELDIFFQPLMMSYVYLLIGFVFYMTKFPECFVSKERFGPKVAYFVQIYLQSHMWWHIFVSLNAYTLYDLSFKAI
jgi:predicted membrane channel-forming protein YqfA (hemolysin III family)